MQFSGGASFAGFSNTAYINANCYFDGSWRYIASTNAGRYEAAANHKWFTSTSGTAGNVISETQTMTLDASGNLGIGNTSPTYKLEVDGTTSLVRARIRSTTAQADVNFSNTGGQLFVGVDTSAGAVTGTAYSSYIYATTSTPLTFSTNSAERARISADGTFRIRGAGVVGSTDAVQFSPSAPASSMALDSSGNLLVGTTTQIGTEKFSVVSSGVSLTASLKGFSGATETILNIWNATTTGDAKFVQFITETGGTSRGTITYNRSAGLVAYNTTSDYRAKDISGSITDSGALIDSTPVYMGKMKGATQERPMFIAHEVPSYAHTGEKDAVDADGNPVYQQMDASALIPVMWAEIQSLRQRLSAANL
jgi:hypothetical protein